jgi:uncharacterized membrane protein YhaH (DUF805 family)/type II secretory pathway pseudopilin PulG
MNWYIAVLKKYAVFSGRARRKEYWMFFLFNVIIAYVFGFAVGLLGAHTGLSGASILTLTQIYTLATLIPSIAVGVRRMHDTDHSGWWLLFPIVNLVFLCTHGKRGDNRFGSDPKAFSSADKLQSKYPKTNSTSSQIVVIILVVSVAFIIIAGIIGTVAIPKFVGASNKAKASEFTAVLTSIYHLEQAQQAENGTYSGLSVLQFDIPTSSRFSYSVDNISEKTFTAHATVKTIFGKAQIGEEATINQDGVKTSGNHLLKYVPTWTSN